MKILDVLLYIKFFEITWLNHEAIRGCQWVVNLPPNNDFFVEKKIDKSLKAIMSEL